MTKEEIATKIAQWLWSKNKVSEAQAVTVHIGKRTYPAARYVEVQKKGVCQTRLYIAAALPPFHERRQLCYQTDPDSEHVWHLVTWFRLKRPCPEWQEVHPLGSSHFILALFGPLEAWATDQCSRKPYRRIEMGITELGPPFSKQQAHEKGKQS
jgi:hypothetical protein